MPSQVVLTLIAAEAGRGFIVELGEAVARAIGARIDWLAPGIAGDVFFDGSADKIGGVIRDLLGDRAGVDWAIQPVARRRKRLLVADLESTIIQNEMLDELADLLGCGEPVAAITRRAMNGEIDFAAALRERVALFKNQPSSLLAAAARRIRITPGAETLVRTMRRNGAQAVLVSGGFQYFCRPIRERLGFDQAFANELVLVGDRLAGTVREPILDSAAKRARLLQYAAESGLKAAHVLAVGDGANDVPMLDAAGLGVAFHAKPRVRERVACRIDHADLTALLYLQGYRAADMVG